MLLAFLALLQDTVRVTHASCATCRIILTATDSLLNTEFEGEAAYRGWHPLSDGRVLLVDFNGRALPALVSRDRATLRSLSRRGDGPGELTNARAGRVLPGDTLLILDRTHRRLELYDANGRWARGFATQRPYDAIRLSNGGFLVSGPSASPRWAGRSLFVYDADGTPRGMWPEPKGPVLPWHPWLQQRVLATVGGEIWAAYPMGYPIIEIRDGRTGAIQRVLYREAAWLPAIDPTIPLPDHRTPTIPDAQLIALLPRDSLVWVIWRAVSPKWRRGVSTSRSERGAEQWMVTKPDLAFDTYVEAYSQRTGALLAARQIDDQILLANAQGGFVRERTSPSEDDWLVSYQFTLSTSRR